MRATIYTRLLGDSTLMGLLPGSVFESGSVREKPEGRYLTYRMGQSVPVIRDANVTVSVRSIVTFYMHDEPGTGLNLDAVTARVRVLMETMPRTAANKVIQIRWLDSTDDILDLAMQDLVRLARFEILHTP